MSVTTPMDENEFKAIIEADWGQIFHPKVRLYIGKFFERTRTGNKLAAKVHGNYGVYRVSIEVKGKETRGACSCYVGGGCHHCSALAHTFLKSPDSFAVIKRKTLRKVTRLEDVSAYLQGTTLDELLGKLKAAGVTQKDFCAAIGMNPRHLSSVKSSELSNRYYKELGAIKLACLWMIELANRPGKSRRK
jgi:hypothetical protein